ncbi:hypothetical protein FHS15_002637 [Paenibacillus castaneae]|uniref:hypothetical protein n=1 Tax=Paenibacillus castaneae TaxID=474957 RepID=UPI0011AF953E|nr:hypothetical protein [Paenibacillus castaneae]NIK77501.1 hypothetical protein [Paenibacillus castaneae]
MNSKKVVFSVMMLLSMFSFIGCGSQESKDQKAEKRILEALQEKYGEEFVLDSIGGGWGTMNSNTLKAIVYPKQDESIRVAVEITKDLKNVYDDYLNEAVAKAAEKPIEQLAKTIWGDVKVTNGNDTGMMYPDHSDIHMSYERFLELYPMNWQLVTIYVQGDSYVDSEGKMDQESEIEKYKEFAKLLADNKYVKSDVIIAYLTPDAYARFNEAQQSVRTVMNFYTNEEEEEGKLNFITMNGYKLDENGQIIESDEKINEDFDRWEETRTNWVEKRGGA